MKWRWYITIAAIKEWMRINRRYGPLEYGNHAFERSENELGELSLTSRLSSSPPAIPGQQLWRGKLTLGSVRQRVECSIAPAQDGGRLPALVWVRLIGRNNRKHERDK